MAPGTFYSDSDVQRFGNWPEYSYGNYTSSPVGTSYQRGSLDGRIFRQLRQQTAFLEDATVRLRGQMNKLQADMNNLQVQTAALQQDVDATYKSCWWLCQKRELVDQAYAEVFQGQLNVLNGGTKDFLEALDAARRSILEEQLGRALQASDDYYTLVRFSGAFFHDGSILDDALKAGETSLQQAYEAAKTELRCTELQVFPQELQALTVRHLVRRPVSALLADCNVTLQSLKRSGPVTAAHLLDDIKAKIESRDPFFTESTDFELNQLVLLGVTMGRACLKRFNMFSSNDYERLSVAQDAPK